MWHSNSSVTAIAIERKFWVGALLVLVQIATAAAYGMERGMSLGLHTVISQFVWKDGRTLEEVPKLTDVQRRKWLFEVESLRQIGAWGGRWNIVTIYQWSDGKNRFPRLKKLIEEHDRFGVKVVLRLIEDPAIYQQLEDSESSEYGFNDEYYAWVKALAKAFGKQVSVFLIGNEAELDLGTSRHGYLARSNPGAPEHVRLRYEDYAKVLVTAVKAIKSVNLGLEVANSGFSDKSIALAIADDIYQNSGINEAQKFWSSWKGNKGVKVEGRMGLYRLLHMSETRRRIKFVRDAVRKPEGSDLFQLHFYGTWRALQTMIDWINTNMEAVKSKRPIIAAEVGYSIRVNRRDVSEKKPRWALDLDFYTEEEHAESLVKTFVTLFGNDVRMALYWYMRAPHSYGGAVRLFPPSSEVKDFKKTKANLAYRVLGDTLNGSELQNGKIPQRHGLWEYRFKAKRDVSVIWGEGSELKDHLDDIEELRSIYGVPISVKQALASIHSEPVYVFWRQPRVSQTSGLSRLRELAWQR